MICSVCGGEVTWRGPLVALTHTQCANCGAINAQIPEHDCETEDDDCESCADTPNRPPLWQVMTQARYDSDGAFYRSVGLATAAEIRAIADEMVMQFDPWLAEHAAVAEWLTAEADRAERGDA